MAEERPLPLQENVLSSRASSPEGECPSSPTLLVLPQQNWSKPRKAPTITPRSFTRFFTPKSSLERGGRIGASRRALRDITASGSNRRGRRTSTKDTICADDVETTKIKKRKRRTPLTPEATPDISSPLKRIRKQSLGILEDDDTDEDVVRSDDEEDEAVHSDHACGTRSSPVGRIVHSRYQSQLGRGLQREIGGHARRPWTLSSSNGNAGSDEWQYETADFYTKPEDAHTCINIASPLEHTIPFCTASCNTNSLVAIGDEDGGVRLLESAKDEKPGFSQPWVSFRPHSNAILDLEFSPDDLLLATASGDQTSQIIDMPTQRATYTMAGHVSSVKQVRFQPESSSVLATSSRDGSVQVWDLRCKGLVAPVRDIKVSLDPGSTTRTPSAHKMTWARSVNTIYEAHAIRQQAISSIAVSSGNFPKSTPSFDAPSRTEIPGRRGDVSITTIAFLPAPRSHLLLTGSEANASVKLWDLRTTHNHRRSSRNATALSSTRQPESHNRHRHFGLTSLSLSGDGARLHTLCRDNTIYAYSTAHLILGSAPEFSTHSASSTKPKRSSTNGHEKEGLGPLYGFRHPQFHATTFYVSSALRPAAADKTELLAVGSSDGCAVVFPTDERYMRRSQTPARPISQLSRGLSNPRRRLGLTRTDSGLAGRLNDTIPIYQHGSALVRGHSREVTGLTWAKGGELVTVGDDFGVRCWREGDREAARGLRMGGEGGGKRWGCGWAEVGRGWDDDDDDE